MSDKTKAKKKKASAGSGGRSRTATGVKKKKVKQKINKKGIIAIIVCSILVLALVVGAVVIHGNSHQNNGFELDVDKDVAQGIDVSAHNGKIDWYKVSGEADFAIIRVGYRGYSNGALIEDKRAKYNLKHAKRAAMPVGVYFYSQAITPKEAEEEADFVLDFIKDYRVTLPVFIDYEYAYDNGELGGRLFNSDLSRSDGTKIISAFTKRVKSAGYTAGVYASSSFYRTKFNATKLDKDTVIWVADYNKRVTYGGYYDIWQHSKTGKCKGVSSKYVDKNNWYLKQKGKK